MFSLVYGDFNFDFSWKMRFTTTVIIEDLHIYDILK